MGRPPISVVIACKDEERHLAACVRSALHWAEEILIADSGSSDRTLEIAHALTRNHPNTCRLIWKEFNGFGKFKGWAVSHACHDWVFVLDADERMTPALASEIDRELDQPGRYDAYLVGFEHHFLGHRIRHGSWNHRVVRLFRKSVGSFDSRAVHERVIIPTGRVGVLSARLEHWTCTDLERWFTKKNHYTSAGAKLLWSQGRRAGLLDILLRPVGRFIKSFVLRAGFLDGTGGLIVAADDAYTELQKYLKLWELTQKLSARNAHLPGDCEKASEPLPSSHPEQSCVRV